MYETLQIMAYLAYQLVQDFFHQQYQCTAWSIRWSECQELEGRLPPLMVTQRRWGGKQTNRCLFAESLEHKWQIFYEPILWSVLEMKVSLGEGILKMFALFAFVFPDPIRDYDETIKNELLFKKRFFPLGNPEFSGRHHFSRMIEEPTPFWFLTKMGKISPFDSYFSDLVRNSHIPNRHLKLMKCRWQERMFVYSILFLLLLHHCLASYW